MNRIRVALIQHPRLVVYALLVAFVVLQVGVVGANDPGWCQGLGC